MTRRERLEARAEKRREWSEKAAARSASAHERSNELVDRIPFGQPVLVGHHSQRRHERTLERSRGLMTKACEESNLAREHERKASSIENALERTIFDDDPDAIERLEARIVERESAAELAKVLNKAYRQGGIAALSALAVERLGKTAGDKLAGEIARVLELCPWRTNSPMSTTGTRASIRADRERIERIRAKRACQAAAADEPGGRRITVAGEWATITFPEKPAREILDALRAAGFSWSGASGSWSGLASKIPSVVAEVGHG